MKLAAVLEIEVLIEGMDLDFVQMYNAYGSWIHPRKPEPVLVKNHQGHADVAAKMIQNPDPGASPYRAMFNDGWIRAVHGNMNNFSISGTKEALAAFLPKIAGLRNVVNRINLDVEDCSGERCRTLNTGSFAMPSEWGAMRRAI